MQLLPPVSKGLFVGTDGTGDSIFVTTNEKNEVDSVDVFRSDGSDDHLVNVMSNTLAAIKPSDLDPKVFDWLKMDDIVDLEDLTTDIESEEQLENVDHNRFLLEEDEESTSTVIETSQPNQKERELQSGCSSYKIVKVAIVFDSTFCSRFGGGNGAVQKAERIVARASMMYQAQGVCAKLRISNLEVRCDPNSDPYRSMVVNGDMSCSRSTSRGILRNFRSFHQSNRRNVLREAAAVHFFFGASPPGNTIGCASVHSMCENSAYGVNDITFTRNELVQVALFAHELGHNAGLRHVDGEPSSGRYVMASGLRTSSFYRWKSTSVSTLRSNFNSRFSCVGTETGGPTQPTPTPPVPSPTPPVPTPTPPSPTSPTSSGEFSKKFVLINPRTGKAVNVDKGSCNKGANIHIWDRNDGGGQVFQYHVATQEIVNVRCNMAIDFSRGSCDRGTNIWLWERNGTGAQKFLFWDKTIRSVMCNGKVLDIYQKDTASGTNIWLYDVNDEWDKEWQVVYI